MAVHLGNLYDLSHLSAEQLTVVSKSAFPNSEIIDPFDGLKDIEQKCLKHTTEAFSEDPLRVLRVARFLARLGVEWQIHHSTKLMMRKIFNSGELENLTAERVWVETEKALSEKNPEMFFEALEGFGIFKELDALRGVEQRADHHPEVDTFVHVMMCLQQGVKMGLTSTELFAILVHDLGKRTANDMRGNLHGHEAEGIPLMNNMKKRMRIPHDVFELGKIVTEHHTRLHTIFSVRPRTVLKLLELTDAIRRPDRFASFLKCCEADAKGRLGLEDRPYHQSEFASKCLEIALTVPTKSIVAEVYAKQATRVKPCDVPVGIIIKDTIKTARINAIKAFIKSHKESRDL
jgi:tRNA nucleotidyltransferase (CCA-adding enzyme)